MKTVINRFPIGAFKRHFTTIKITNVLQFRRSLSLQILLSYFPGSINELSWNFLQIIRSTLFLKQKIVAKITKIGYISLCKYYYGSTSDIDKRIRNHNAGKVRSTKNRRPLKLNYTEEFELKSEAIKREKFFKSRTGYNWLKKNKII